MNDNLPVPAYGVADIDAMAQQVAKSRMFGMDASQAFTLMLLCQAKGLHPIQAVERYHVIQGRPAMKADAILADFQARGGVVDWRTSTDTECEAVFAHPSCPKGFASRFTIADAKRAKLAGKDNWANYPAAMLRARVISQGVRACLPGVVSGIYTQEEVQDFAPSPALKQEDAVVNGHARDVAPKPAMPVAPEPDRVEPWDDFVLRVVRTEVDEFDAEVRLALGGDAVQKKKHVTRWQVANHLLKWAVAAGHYRAESVPETKRHVERWQAVAALYDGDPEKVRGEVTRYLNEQRERARVEAGLDPETGLIATEVEPAPTA
jgi:hypothetical protein